MRNFTSGAEVHFNLLRYCRRLNRALCNNKTYVRLREDYPAPRRVFKVLNYTNMAEPVGRYRRFVFVTSPGAQRFVGAVLVAVYRLFHFWRASQKLLEMGKC